MWIEITIRHNNRNMQALWNTTSDILIREFDVEGQLIVERNVGKPMYILSSYKKMREQLIGDIKGDIKKELKKFMVEENNVVKVDPYLKGITDRLPPIESIQPGIPYKSIDAVSTVYAPKQVLTPNDVTSETVKATAAKIPRLKKDKGE